MLPPDVHLSGEGFTVEDDGRALRVGLSYCKGLSEKAIATVVSERAGKPFASVADLYQRTAVERNSLENLVRDGFLDALGSWAALLREAKGLSKKRRREGEPEIPLEHPASWWTARESRDGESVPTLVLAEDARERMEWEVLGLNVRGHPLVPYRAALHELGVVPSEEVKSLAHGRRVRAAGLIECLQHPPTQSGHPVWFLLVEDEQGLLQAALSQVSYGPVGCKMTLRSGSAFFNARGIPGAVQCCRGRLTSERWDRDGSLRVQMRRVRRAVRPHATDERRRRPGAVPGVRLRRVAARDL